MLAPELAAREATRRKFGHLGLDSNNFSHPDQLTALLGPYQMISFDLFDTLIWRDVAIVDVHLKTAEFGERVITGDDGPLPSGLLIHCRGRHQEAVKAAGMVLRPGYRNEIDLADVFDTALAPYILDSGRRSRAVEALIAFEIETERRALLVNPIMRDFLVRLRGQGKVVILISDMYLRERWLRLILKDHGLDGLFDHVFVSCDVGVTKNSGMIFDHVDDVLRSHDWRKLHLGDNWENDVIRPREHGWDALHYFNRENEIHKDQLERISHLGVHRHPAAARRLIANIEAGDPDESLVRLISAGFLSFARQVLATACQGRFDRVLFLTRDGTIYHQLLDQVIEDSGAAASLNLPPLEDLAFSRRAGVLLTCPSWPDPEWPSYIQHHVRWMQDMPASLAAIISTFALTAEDMNEMQGMNLQVDLCINGTPGADIDFDNLMAMPEVLAGLNAALQAKRKRVIDYLDQQDIFAPDQKILLVDIGYSGTVLKSLSEYMYALEAQGQTLGTRITMMMFAANRFYAGNLARMHPRAAMLDPVMIGRANWQDRAAAFNFAWLEPFAVDRSRGSLRDFRPDKQGVIHPVFGPGNEDEGPVSRTRILRTARQIDRLLRMSPVGDKDVDTAIGQVIVERFARPKRSTLAAVTGLTHQAGLTETVEGGLLRQIRLWRLRSDLSLCLQEDRWVQGSMAASRLGWLNPLLNRVIGLISK